jgi:hypothetical protein
VKLRAFTKLSEIERAFEEFDKSDGHPLYTADGDQAWGRVASAKRLEDARSFNDFAAIITPGKFPADSQLVVFCALQVFGERAFEYWSILREHYCRGKPRASSSKTDRAVDVWDAIDAGLQSWLYSPASCRLPQNRNNPSEWLTVSEAKTRPHICG